MHHMIDNTCGVHGLLLLAAALKCTAHSVTVPDAMWARAEGPRYRTLADLQMVEYPASGDPSEPIDSMRHLHAVSLYDPCLLIFVWYKTFASFHIAMRKQICSC